MTGRALFTGFFIFLAIFAAGLFYTINYAYYDTEVSENFEIAGLDVESYRQIDASTSPIKFRACFMLPANTKLYGEKGEPTPLVAPFWFDCFNAKTLSEDLQAGTAQALAYERNNPYGVSSYIAVYPDGRAYAWRQLNECGEAKFSGETLPPDCEQSE